MRFQRSLALVAVAFLWWALGPWVVLALGVAAVVPPSRRWLWWWLDPTWKVAGIWAGTVLVLVGLVVVIPDGWLPIPPGAGAWVTPGYVGRPAVAQPIDMTLPKHPGLAPPGTSSMHDDPWSSDAYAWSGPLGESPEVDTAWFGLEECATLAVDTTDRLIGLCGDLHGPVLHVIDPDSMRPVATKDLPDRVGGGAPWANLCAGAYFYLDDHDRAVVATTDRRILVVSTHDSEGDPDLTTQASYDLSDQVPSSDCLLALMPDWDGSIWFATQDGRVGTVDPDTGHVAVLDLGEEIANSISVDAEGGVYVVTTEALYRIARPTSGPRPSSRPPEVTWRTAYDRGSQEKSGQLSQGSGTTPTLLPGGLVAITDNADPQMHVAFYRRDNGAEVCSAPVFGDDRSATENSLVSVGDGGVVVENNHGYDSPLSTVLGRTTDAGLARVDVVDAAAGTCRVAWTTDVAAPSSVPKVSLANGLLYAYTKEHSWWGVDAWYVSAIDVRTGRRVWAVRTGTGLLRNNHYAAITITQDSSLYIATLGGLVRVRDRGVG